MTTGRINQVTKILDIFVYTKNALEST